MSCNQGTDSALLTATLGLSMLNSRAEFLRHLRLALAVSAAGQPPSWFSILAINLTGFRKVNKDSGHAAGDAVINNALQRIISCIGSENVAAHDGGDDFFILAHYTSKESMVRPLLDSLSLALELPYDLPIGTFFCPPRFGISSHPHDGSDAELLVRNASRALQVARSGARGNTVFHNDGLQEDYDARKRMTKDLASAHEHGEFSLNYQPIYRAGTRQLTGAEALLSWNHPEHGTIGPEVFLADAEESGLIVAIEQWAFTEICHQVRQRIDAGQALPVSMSVSLRHITESFPVEWMRQTILHYRIPDGMLAFQMKIGTDLPQAEACLQWMKQCRQLGISIHINDFTGSLHSLALIAKGCVDEVRIGHELLRHLHTSSSVRKLIQSVIDFGNDSSIRISAVGVEDASTADVLAEMGCQQLQGLYLGQVFQSLRFPPILPKSNAETRFLRLVSSSGIRTLLQ